MAVTHPPLANPVRLTTRDGWTVAKLAVLRAAIRTHAGDLVRVAIEVGLPAEICDCGLWALLGRTPEGAFEEMILSEMRT